MKKAVFLILGAITLAGACYASAGVTSVFDIGVGVKSQSLGGAYTAGADDSSSIFYNPAGLQTLDKFEIQGAYIPLFADTNYNFLAAAFPTADFGCFGFSFAMLNTDKITLRDYTGTPINVASQLMLEIEAGWGISLFTKEFSAGFNIKVDTQSMSVYNDSGFGADLGFMYNTQIDSDSFVRGALTIRNLIEPQVKMSLDESVVPRQYVLGGCYGRNLTKDINAEAYLDLYMPVGIAFVFKAGAEAEFLKIFSVRAGYDSYNISSLGAGINLFNVGAIDYGVFFTEIGLSHRFTLKARFGDSVIEQRANKEKLELEKIEKKARLLAAEELKGMREKIDKMAGEAKKSELFKATHYTKGLENYYDGNLKMSLLEFETVYQVDTEYMNTRYYIGLIKGILGQGRDQLYSDEIIRLYRSGVDKYVKEDYAGARDEWEKILKLDPVNRLAIENLKEVNSILRNLEDTNK
jgi:hypothetical protein